MEERAESTRFLEEKISFYFPAEAAANVTYASTSVVDLL
jgi:hypothetical protein